MSKTFKLKVVTPRGTIVDSEIVYLELKTPEGSLGILANHEPCLAQLADGKIHYRLSEGADLQTLEVKDAYFSFLGNKAEVVSALG